LGKDQVPGKSCPVCASEDAVLYHAATIEDPAQVSFSYTFSPQHSRTFQALRCLGCSHVYCFPLPPDMAAHYHDVVDEEYLRHDRSRQLSARKVLDRLGRRGPARLLDVGCATGDWLVAAREAGFEAEGLELSEWSARIARERGFVVHQKRLAALAEEHPGTYDVITLMGVIEHFERPREETHHLRRLLKPGGRLVLWTGDVDSILSRALGRKWWYWQGQHIQYFTKASLRRLLLAEGFAAVEVATFPFAATLATISNSLRRYRLQPVMIRLLSPLFRLKPVLFLRLPGEMLAIADGGREDT
jgi:2-polyprenyl-3-methyl-5-hydroxy-6-metoxy-1,4-benzoquinol methylase